MFLMVLFATNLMVFLLDEPMANAPMLGVLKAWFSGDTSNIDWTVLLVGNRVEGSAINLIFEFIKNRAIIITVFVLVMIGLSTATGSVGLSGIGGGGFGATQAGLVIALAIFVVLFLVPNFSFMGFPYPVDIIIYSLYGFMAALALFGLFRGE